jgi:GH43 family beta-xylosidase
MSYKGGIYVAESRYLSGFEDGKTMNEAMKLVWQSSDDDRDWNARQIWAPEIHCVDGVWYIFYAGGRQYKGPYWEQRAAVLVSFDGPFGPYIAHDDKPLFTGN